MCNCENNSRFYTEDEFNPIHTRLFWLVQYCSTGGGVYHLHPITPLSFKSDDSNFVQNYFGGRINIPGQEK